MRRDWEEGEREVSKDSEGTGLVSKDSEGSGVGAEGLKSGEFEVVEGFGVDDEEL